MPQKINIHPSWYAVLEQEFTKAYFLSLTQKIKQEILLGQKIYPPGKLIFNAFNSCHFDSVKVVILGQDPYHNPGEAMGLSFSVPKKIKTPPSLKNIYKEMHQDIEFEIPSHGDLSPWAQQGVLLLNAILTVEHKKAGSHRKLGWERFTDTVIHVLSERKENIVFMLWGNFAKSKASLINKKKHLVLEAAHPSPLARGAFFNCKHFSKTNNYLLSKGLKSIDWVL